MYGRGRASHLAELAEPGPQHLPGGGGRRLALGISELGSNRRRGTGGRWWERVTKRGRARAVGEAVGSGRPDSCHMEMASGLTASCVKRLRVVAAVLWKPAAV